MCPVGAAVVAEENQTRHRENTNLDGFFFFIYQHDHVRLGHIVYLNIVFFKHTGKHIKSYIGHANNNDVRRRRQ